MAVAVGNVVLDLHQGCEVFTALLLQDKPGWELEPAGPLGVELSLEGLETSSCCWVVAEVRQPGQWGRAEQLWCHVLASPSLRARHRTSAPPHGMRAGCLVTLKRFEICG